jgi:hypothetical protein
MTYAGEGERRRHSGTSNGERSSPIFGAGKRGQLCDPSAPSAADVDRPSGAECSSHLPRSGTRRVYHRIDEVRPWVLLLVLVGCGGSAEDDAQFDWETGSGPAYAAFQEGYRNGVAEGCELAREKSHDDDPEAYFGAIGGLCAYPPTSPQEETPGSPPTDPEAAG